MHLPCHGGHGDIYIYSHRKQVKDYYIYISIIPTNHSNRTNAIPDDAPAPARPTKCSLPILLENKLAPT
jgi:hypothetical protein